VQNRLEAVIEIGKLDENGPGRKVGPTHAPRTSRLNNFTASSSDLVELILLVTAANSADCISSRMNIILDKDGLKRTHKGILFAW
jgi:hypothetical protein